MNLLIISAKRFLGYHTLIAATALTLMLTGCGTEITSNVSSQERLIVNGKRVLRKDFSQFSPVVGLLMDSGKSFCTATHLGNGYFLSATHCVAQTHKLDKNDKPTFRVSALNRIRSSRASEPDEVEFSFGPDIVKTTLLDPLPVTEKSDVLIIQFKGEFAKELKNIPVAAVAEEELLESDESFRKGFGFRQITTDRKFTIAGYGLDQFDTEVASIAHLNTAKVNVVHITKSEFLSSYNNKEEGGAIWEGDSGGPLFEFVKDKMIVYGVASGFQYDEDELKISGDLKTGTNKHARIDKKNVREWIASTLAKK